MWNIVDHSSVALAYTDLGIALGSRCGLSYAAEGGHSTYRRTYRSLLMIRGYVIAIMTYCGLSNPPSRWLSATLSQTPSSCVQSQMQVRDLHCIDIRCAESTNLIADSDRSARHIRCKCQRGPTTRAHSHHSHECQYTRSGNEI